MTKITISADCGNAPKKEFLKEVNIAFATGNVAFLSESATEQIVWNIVGDKRIEGKHKFVEELEQMQAVKATELLLHQIITHGREAAAHGVMVLQNGKKYAFSDFYEFSGAKGNRIQRITSYVIPI